VLLAACDGTQSADRQCSRALNAGTMTSNGSHTCQPLHTRIAFLLIDGVGDVSVPRLGHRTPLQVADTPTLDAIAGEPHVCNNSMCGQLHLPVVCDYVGKTCKASYCSSCYGITTWFCAMHQQKGGDCELAERVQKGKLRTISALPGASTFPHAGQVLATSCVQGA
jgi:hypothetical protein